MARNTFIFQKSRCEKLCTFITFDIFDYAIVKFGLFAFSLCFGGFWLFQTVLFCHKADIMFFIQYGPMYFTSLYLLLCISSLYPIATVVKRYLKKIKSWVVTPVPEIEDGYDKDLFLTTVYIVVVVGLALLTSVLFIIPTSEDKNMYFIVFISEEYLYKVRYFLSWTGRLSFIPLTYISVVQPSLRGSYCWILMKYHIKLCMHRIISLNETEIFDEDIETELKFCLNYHSKICQILTEVINSLQIYVLPFQIVGTLLIVNIVVYYFWFQDSLTDQYPRLIALGVTAFVTLGNLTQHGQELEDFTSNIFDRLVEVNWCDWNETNKKLYLMFLMKTQKPCKFKYSENISINYKMGVEMVKAFFSFISVMVRLQK